MILNKLSERIYYLSHNSELDRPMLAYIKGDKFSLAIDAGYSSYHVNDFYKAIKKNGFKEPDFTVITHWHYDHTFGMDKTSGITIAYRKTNEHLKEEQEKAKDKNYIKRLKDEDIYFAKEYSDKNEVNIVLSDFEFSDNITLNLGSFTANIFHTISPHSDDSTCIYVQEEKVLFLGDSTSEDFFNGGYMDKAKLLSLFNTINSIDCEYCILSHAEPLKKQELLQYLKTIIN